MKRVIIESPFRPLPGGAPPYGEQETLRQNIIYARLALLDCLSRGEAPLASHLLYTQVWAETAELRRAGIEAGLEHYLAADLAVHYVDLGESEGMQRAWGHAEKSMVAVEKRRLYEGLTPLNIRGRLKQARLTMFPALCDGRPYLTRTGAETWDRRKG